VHDSSKFDEMLLFSKHDQKGTMRYLTISFFIIFWSDQALARKWVYAGGFKSKIKLTSKYQTLDGLTGDATGALGGIMLADKTLFAVSLEGAYRKYEYEEKLCPWLTEQAKLIMTDKVSSYGIRVWLYHWASASFGYVHHKMSRKLIDRDTGADITTVQFQWKGTDKGYYAGVAVHIPIFYVYPYAGVTRHWAHNFNATESEVGVMVVF